MAAPRKYPEELRRAAGRTPGRAWSTGALVPTRRTGGGSPTPPTVGPSPLRAFVTDVFSRRVVGWQLSTSLRTDLALDTGAD